MPNSLYDNFITLQAVFREILRGDGGNDFKIPHLKKQYMRRAGKEVTKATCDGETILKANAFLDKAIVQVKVCSKLVRELLQYIPDKGFFRNVAVFSGQR